MEAALRIARHAAPAWWLALAAFAMTVVLAAWRPGPWDWEQRLLELAAVYRPPALHYALFLLTQAGGTMPVVATGLAFAALLARRAGAVPAAAFAAAVAGGLLVTYALKAVLAVERPADLFQTGFGAAFPSAHASGTATLFMAAAVLLTPPGRRERRIAVAAAVVLATTVGLTRVWLGVHWPLDVIGGIALGAVVGALPAPLAPRVTRASPACRAGMLAAAAAVLVLACAATAVFRLPIGADEYPGAPPARNHVGLSSERSRPPLQALPQRSVRSLGTSSRSSTRATTKSTMSATFRGRL